jgi:hypothetical protein
VIRRGAPVLVASLLLAACGESNRDPIPVVAGVAELTGPYQAEPFQAFDPALVGLLRDACLDLPPDEARPEQGLQAVLVDGRGGGRFMLFMAAPNGVTDCIGRLDARGVPSIDGVHSGNGGAGVLGPHEVLPGSNGSNSGPGAWSWAVGEVGPEFGGVLLEFGDGTSVAASVGGLRYAAWWPGAQKVDRILAYDRTGDLVADTPP